VNAENYGAVSPCEGRIEIYVNQNSEVRNLDLRLIYLNISDSVLSKEQIRMELEDTPTGMYQKEVPLSRIARESCRNVQINIKSMVCFSADRSAVECPQVRIHQPDTYRLISVDDKSIEVCSAG
jgi:transglutaminase/protease-like cytokinesis protein 3